MQVDIFREILIPVIGGLGIFMLGLEFMSDGIGNLAAHRMRAWLAKIAGTPVKGLFPSVPARCAAPARLSPSR